MDYTTAMDGGSPKPVTTTAQEIAPLRRGRLFFECINQSDTKVWIRLGAGAFDPGIAGTGIPIDPGASYFAQRYADAVWAVHLGTGTKYVTVVEV